MKKETQNLAYPPAFKVAPISISLDVKTSPCSWRWPCSRRSTASTPPPRSSTLPGGGSSTGCDRWHHLRHLFVLLVQHWNENSCYKRYNIDRYNVSLLPLFNSDSKARRAHFKRPHEEDDRKVKTKIILLLPLLNSSIVLNCLLSLIDRGPKNRDIDQALYTWYCER